MSRVPYNEFIGGPDPRFRAASGGSKYGVGSSPAAGADFGGRIDADAGPARMSGLPVLGPSPLRFPMDARGTTAVAALPAALRPLFPFARFNVPQSRCLGALLGSGSNVVVASPTGSGKTALFELAIGRVLGMGAVFAGTCTHREGGAICLLDD
jgi:hypothetical protein